LDWHSALPLAPSSRTVAEPEGNIRHTLPKLLFRRTVLPSKPLVPFPMHSLGFRWENIIDGVSTEPFPDFLRFDLVPVAWRRL
jgi:hypothetical protein